MEVVTNNLSIKFTYLNNITNQASERNEDLARAEIGVLSAILILAILGNLTVFIVFLCQKRRLTRMHLFMLHLSAADLSVGFFSVLPQLVWEVTYVFQGNDFLCRTVKYFQIVVIYASTYVLVMTAIDRYFAICYPLVSHQWSARHVHYLVGAAWTFAFLFSLPQIFIFSYMEKTPGVFDCWATFVPAWTLELYITFNTVTVYIIPTLTLIFCYGRICYSVWKRGEANGQFVASTNGHCSSSNTGNLHRPEAKHAEKDNSLTLTYRRTENGSIIPRAKVRTVRMTLTVVLCYLICWSPYYIAQMWAAFDPNAPFRSSAYTIILLLASLNSCTNPWIYLLFSARVPGKAWCLCTVINCRKQEQIPCTSSRSLG